MQHRSICSINRSLPLFFRSVLPLHIPCYALSCSDCSSFQSSQSLAKKGCGFASLRRIFSTSLSLSRALGLTASCTRAGISGRCSLTALQSGRFGVVADTEGTSRRILVSASHYSAPLSRRQVRSPFPHPRRKGATRPLKPRDLSEGTGGREEDCSSSSG